MTGRIMITIGALYLFLLKFVPGVMAQSDRVQADEGDIGFPIPDLGEFLGFFIRLFFVIAGLLALFYMLWGALSWVTSGGESEGVDAARKKIIAAAVGVLLIVATLAVVVALETIVFNRQICFGISCPLQLPQLLQECVETNDEGRCTRVCVETDDDGNCVRTEPVEGTVSSSSSSAGTGSDSENSGGVQLPATGGN